MPDNYDIADALGQYAKLCELHDENPFKYKAIAAAAFNLKKIKDPLENMNEDELKNLPGVGKSVQGYIKQILQHGSFTELNEILEQTPSGVQQILRIKGLGPKKVQLIWHELGIDNLPDLFNACRENRLVEQKGFGYKTQSEILRNIEFALAAKGKTHFARAEKPATEMIKYLKTTFPKSMHSLTGEIRRACDIIEQIEIVTTATTGELHTAMLSLGNEPTNNPHEYKNAQENIFRFYFSEENNFNRMVFETTATEEHLTNLNYHHSEDFTTEENYYLGKNISFIIPEMREGKNEIEFAKKYSEKELIQYDKLKGVLHNHSTYSDGLNTLEDMGVYCKELGYEYFGIADHSKTAAYAQGLQVERVLNQWKEIDELNKKLAPFKILKGIESDILNDGNLDYEADILSQFDYVVASVHSNLRMDETKANERLKTAIENPYTSILGHPTGRLLLVREGYPINHEYIIDCCAANGVAIELNANPFRLDIDWRWIDYAQNKNVFISINPDAHEKSGIHDMYFGTLSARKGGLLLNNCLNAMGLAELDNWLNKKRSKTN